MTCTGWKRIKPRTFLYPSKPYHGSRTILKKQTGPDTSLVKLGSLRSPYPGAFSYCTAWWQAVRLSVFLWYWKSPLMQKLNVQRSVSVMRIWEPKIIWKDANGYQCHSHECIRYLGLTDQESIGERTEGSFRVLKVNWITGASIEIVDKMWFNNQKSIKNTSGQILFKI